jgi:hypothetical protein
MMNFDVLSQAGQQAKETQEDADHKWSILLEQAQNQIHQFHRFGQAELLPQASESLLKIHEQKPSWAEPLAWLAYILFLQKQDHLATQYIESTLSRQPDQPLALRLQDALEQETDQSHAPEAPSVTSLRSIRRLTLDS